MNKPLSGHEQTPHCGAEEGQYLHFDFYVDRSDGSSITPSEAHDLLWRLIHWIREREQGYGFDGGAKLGNPPTGAKPLIRIP